MMEEGVVNNTDSSVALLCFAAMSVGSVARMLPAVVQKSNIVASLVSTCAIL